MEIESGTLSSHWPDGGGTLFEDLEQHRDRQLELYPCHPCGWTA